MTCSECSKFKSSPCNAWIYRRLEHAMQWNTFWWPCSYYPSLGFKVIVRYHLAHNISLTTLNVQVFYCYGRTPLPITRDRCWVCLGLSFVTPLYRQWYVFTSACLRPCVTDSHDRHKQVLLIVSPATCNSTFSHCEYSFILTATTLTDPLDVRPMKVTFIITLFIAFLSVNDISSISIILFDTVVVAVTLASTLGTWRVYRRSAWNGLSLTQLLAQQSKSCPRCRSIITCRLQYIRSYAIWVVHPCYH
jgi:hypothetical protein